MTVARVNMQWEQDLKDRVQDRVGKRGLTEFTVQAVEAKLAGHDTSQDLDKELNQTRDLAQQLADALVRSGDADDARARVMEIDLPAWLETTGWPQEFADLVPIEDAAPEPVNVPSSDPDEVIQQGPHSPQVAASAPTHGYTEEDLAKPSWQVAGEVSLRNGETATITTPPVVVTEGGSLLDRVRAKAAEKGVDMDGMDLKPASSLPKPPAPERPEPDPQISQVERLEVPGGPGNPHNHVFERVDGILCCDCGGWIDESTTPGKFVPGADEEALRLYGEEEKATVSLQTAEGVDSPAYPRQQVTWAAAGSDSVNAEPVTFEPFAPTGEIVGVAVGDASAPDTCPHGSAPDDCWECF